VCTYWYCSGRVPNGHWAQEMEAVFEVTGKIFSALFTIECVAKIVAQVRPLQNLAMEWLRLVGSLKL